MERTDQTIQVLIFQTNISRKKDVEKAGNTLSKNPDIFDWNIDTGDKDNVLRVEAEHLSSEDVIEMIRKMGFECQELPD